MRSTPSVASTPGFRIRLSTTVCYQAPKCIFRAGVAGEPLAASSFHLYRCIFIKDAELTALRSSELDESEVNPVSQSDPWLSLGVLLSTAATDAVYVMFNAAVAAKRRVPAASWSSVWYLLSAFAVISYTKNWVYIVFAAAGSWIGAYISMTVLGRSESAPLRGPNQ